MISIFNATVAYAATLDSLTVRRSSDPVIDLSEPARREWAFGTFGELAELSDEEVSICTVCYESLQHPKKKIAICAGSSKHLFHAYCLLRTNTEGEWPGCPLCRYPINVSGFHRSFEQLIYKTVAGGGTGAKSDSPLYRCILNEGALLHLSNFDYSRLFLEERICLLSTIDSITSMPMSNEGAEDTDEMRLEVARNIIDSIMHYEAERLLLPNAARRIIMSMVKQFATSQDIYVIGSHVDTTCRYILCDYFRGSSFMVLCSFIYLVMESKLDPVRILLNIRMVLSNYCKRTVLRLHEAYILIHLFVTKIEWHVGFIDLLQKDGIAAYSEYNDTPYFELPDLMLTVKQYIDANDIDALRNLVREPTNGL